MNDQLLHGIDHEISKLLPEMIEYFVILNKQAQESNAAWLFGSLFFLKDVHCPFQPLVLPAKYTRKRIQMSKLNINHQFNFLSNSFTFLASYKQNVG